MSESFKIQWRRNTIPVPLRHKHIPPVWMGIFLVKLLFLVLWYQDFNYYLKNYYFKRKTMRLNKKKYRTRKECRQPLVSYQTGDSRFRTTVLIISHSQYHTVLYSTPMEDRHNSLPWSFLNLIFWRHLKFKWKLFPCKTVSIRSIGMAR